MANCTCKKWGCEEDCICACHREENYEIETTNEEN